MLRVLRLYLKVAIFQPEQRSTLRILRLYLKVAIVQPELQEHAPRTTFVLRSCDFQAGAAADQRGIEPATADCESRRKPRDNFQRPSHEQQNRTAPQRKRFDTHDLRRGFAETKKNSHGASARALRHAQSPQRVHPGMSKTQEPRLFAPRPRRSPQRVAREPQKQNAKKKPRVFAIPAEGRAGTAKKHQKTSSFCTSTTPIPAEGRGNITKRKKTSSFCTSTTPISSEGRIPPRRQHPHPPP